MKRVLSLFISLLFSVSLYSNPSVGITIGEISVSIGENMEDVVKKMGVPNRVEVLPWEYNHDWDTICYEYGNITIWFYRIVNSVNRMEAICDSNTSGEHDLLINIYNVECKVGETRSEIDRKLGKKGFPLGTHTDDHLSMYLYEFKDFLEAVFLYNQRNRLQGFSFGYVYP